MSKNKLSLTRRETLAGLTVASAATLTPMRANAANTPARLPERACILTPQAAEGPFYFDPKLVRSDITEGRPGVPLRVLLQVVDAATCKPLAGARVDLWHADAKGAYSGYDRQGDGRESSTKGETFLRGTQIAGASGQVAFRTIYPGWYPGRTPHAHFEIFLDEKNVLTGQLYFPDALSEFIYANVAPYNTRSRARDTRNADDGVLRGNGGSHDSFVSIKEETDHYLATLGIGVDRSGSGMPARGGPPGPPPEGAARRAAGGAPDSSTLVPGVKSGIR